ncbi:hypothetical protein CNEO2_500011 [Clostridium neonatale]|uniref:Uncharacterized protein n=1 Tax=Clostridium neonatale TaxID=137838 RepID=A0AAD1YIM1_9CLOT|nr:hypothetical protein CNEO2_500011 [Clostridium neonatale]
MLMHKNIYFKKSIFFIFRNKNKIYTYNFINKIIFKYLIFFIEILLTIPYERL